MVLAHQRPTLALPGFESKVSTEFLIGLELLGVHVFFHPLAFLTQVSGLAAGYLFTASPEMRKLVARCEYQLDRVLREQGIKLPAKHRWKLAISNFGRSVTDSKWWAPKDKSE